MSPTAPAPSPPATLNGSISPMNDIWLGATTVPPPRLYETRPPPGHAWKSIRPEVVLGLIVIDQLQGAVGLPHGTPLFQLPLKASPRSGAGFVSGQPSSSSYPLTVSGSLGH